MRHKIRLKLFVFACAMVILFVPLLPASARASTASSWNNTGGALSAESIGAMVVDSAHNVLYATGVKGVWRCDNPDTAPVWTNMGGPVNTRHARCLVYDAAHNRLYAGTDSGVWTCKNPNGAPLWSNTGGPPKASPASALAYDKSRNKLYAGTDYEGVWRCDNPDSSHVWSRFAGPIKDAAVTSIVCDEARNILYIGCMGTVSILADANLEDVWRCAKPDSATPVWSATGFNQVAFELAFDKNRNVLYAGTSSLGGPPDKQFGLHCCSQPNTSPKWTNYQDPSGYVEVGSIAVDESRQNIYFSLYQNPATLMPGYGEGVWSGPSSPSGDWTSTGDGLSTLIVNDLCFDGTRDILYAATESGVWRYGAAKGASTFYFAEGTCRPGFDTYFTIQNPGSTPADVNITYMKGDGTSDIQQFPVAGNSRATVNARDKLGEGDNSAHDFSAKVSCSNGRSIIVERPMYFNYKGVWTGGHDVMGALAPASTFYFAEGSCRTGFDTYLCIQNPGSSVSKVKVTYMKGDGSVTRQAVTINPHARATIAPKDTLGQGDDAAHDFSAKVETTNGTAIVCERPMYFDYKGMWTGGSDVIGAVVPAQVFYFAEGTCRPGFDPYLCIQNPSNADINVDITYFKGDGTVDTQNLYIQQNYRTTVNVKDKLGEGEDTAHDFSCKVESVLPSISPPIVCERSVYFNYKGALTGGHDVLGAMSPAATFYFAEGTCRPGFDPYLSIQNPGSVDADVNVTYMKGDETVDTQTLTVAKGSRSTVTVKDRLGEGDDAAHDFSAKVECTNGQEILCERPMYFNYNGQWSGGSDVIGLH